MNKKNEFYIEESPQKSKSEEIPLLALQNLDKFSIPNLRFVNRDKIAQYILNYFDLNTASTSLSQKTVINLCQNFGAGLIFIKIINLFFYLIKKGKSSLIDNILKAAGIKKEEQKNYKILSLDFRSINKPKDNDVSNFNNLVDKIIELNVEEGIFKIIQKRLNIMDKIKKLDNSLEKENILKNFKEMEKIKILINFDEVDKINEFKFQFIDKNNPIKNIYDFWNSLTKYIELPNVLISFTGKSSYLSLIGKQLFRIGDQISNKSPNKIVFSTQPISTSPCPMKQPKLINFNEVYTETIIVKTNVFYNGNITKYKILDVIKLLVWDIKYFIYLTIFNSGGIPRIIFFIFHSLFSFYKSENSKDIDLFFNKHALNNQVDENLNILYIENYKNYYPFLLFISNMDVYIDIYKKIGEYTLLQIISDSNLPYTSKDIEHEELVKIVIPNYFKKSLEKFKNNFIDNKIKIIDFELNSSFLDIDKPNSFESCFIKCFISKFFIESFNSKDNLNNIINSWKNFNNGIFKDCDFFNNCNFKIEPKIINCPGFKDINKDEIDKKNKSTYQFLNPNPKVLLNLIKEGYFLENHFSKPPPKSEGPDSFLTLNYDLNRFDIITKQKDILQMFNKNKNEINEKTENKHTIKKKDEEKNKNFKIQKTINEYINKNKMEIDENKMEIDENENKEDENENKITEKKRKKNILNDEPILKLIQIQNKCISKSTNSDIKNNGIGINDIKVEIKKAEPLYHDKFDILYLITSTKYDEDLFKKIESKNYFKKGEKFEGYELKFNLFIMKTKDLENLLGKNLFNFFLNFDPTKKNEFKFEYLNFLNEDDEKKILSTKSLGNFFFFFLNFLK
jgi:hypothetical protein